MSYIEKIITSVLEKQFSPQKAFSRIIQKRLKVYSITLRKKQISKIEREFNIDHLDSFHLDLDKEQIQQLHSRLGTHTNVIEMEFHESDFSELDKEVKELTKILIDELTAYFSNTLVKAWRKQSPSLIKKIKSERKSFEKNLIKIWGNALDNLEMLLGASWDISSEFCNEFYDSPEFKNDIVFDVLRRLQARACQVGYEILSLLRAGFPNGAMARWRTIHEIAMTSLFIAKHGNKVTERYLDHVAITNYHEALAYNEHCLALNQEPISGSELIELENEKKRMCEKYGNEFDSDYGWASSVISKKNNKINFSQIEENVSQEYIRPYYKLANINIHAGSKGILFSLGLPPDDQFLINSGPSNYGLTSPGQLTSTSILQSTKALLQIGPDLDRFTALKAIEMIADQVLEEFGKADQYYAINHTK